MIRTNDRAIHSGTILCPDEANYLLDATQDAILVISTEGRIIYANKGIANMVGMRPSVLIGADLIEVLFEQPDSAADVLTALDSCQNCGRWAGMLQLSQDNEISIQLQTRWSLLSSFRDHYPAILMVATDTTEQRNLENKLRRTQRLESLGTMATGIAHDLNNILTPIVICSGMLRTATENPQCDQYLDAIEKNAKRGADVIKQILTFARGGSGKKSHFNIEIILKEITRMVAETFPKSIECQTHFSSNAWPVLGNATQLHQVFMNLLINARDAMLLDGGQIKISLKNRHLTQKDVSLMSDGRPGTYLVVDVEDAGVGIRNTDLERIFDPFFTTKQADHGTGLGLATVRGIIQEHGGFILVKSSFGHGTLFKVFLPANPKAIIEEVYPTSPNELTRGNGETILVVDDEPSIGKLVCKALEENGYSTIQAKDGVEAIEKYLQHKASMVITDLDMPQLNGVTLLRTLKKLEPELRTICISGSVTDDVSEQLGSLGVKTILNKPFQMQALLTQVHQALQK